MARSGDTDIVFNPKFFDTVLREPRVEQVVDAAAGRALRAAQSTAPVDTEAYRDGLHIEHHDSRFRRSARVVGSDPKTMLIEAKTGNLARAVKAARS